MDYDFVKPHHYGLIKPEEAKFIFEQGEKHLKDQIETSQQIGTKTTTLLTVVSSLLIGVIGFAITRWSTSGFDSLIATAITGSLYLYYIVHLLLENIKPQLYRSVGLHPRDIFDDRVFRLENKEYRMEALYINEIKECQKRIDFNSEKNNGRWERFNRALRLVSYAPAIFIVCYATIRIFALFWHQPGCAL